jgi:uncharacterized membrane protein YGL010W
MKTLSEHLSTYAQYHRDRRNLATHFVGVPMIVVAVATLLSRPAFSVAGVSLSPASFAIAGSMLFYFLLDLRFGLTMAIWFGGAGWIGAMLAAQSTAVWLTTGLGAFAIGWIIQFVGHGYEGRKPAFADDLSGFLIGPLFMTAEAGFAAGARIELLEEIEANAGPTRVGRAEIVRTA